MQLELEQTKLKLHEAELEKEIRKDWKQLKTSLKPINLGKELWKNMTQKRRSPSGSQY